MSHSIHRLALLALVGALGVLVFMPGAASSGGYGCPDGSYCLWTKPNYNGHKLVIKTNKLVNLPKGIKNKVSSMKNHKDDRDVLLHMGKNGNGLTACQEPNTEVSQFSNTFDNDTASVDAVPVGSCF